MERRNHPLNSNMERRNYPLNPNMEGRNYPLNPNIATPQAPTRADFPAREEDIFTSTMSVFIQVRGKYGVSEVLLHVAERSSVSSVISSSCSQPSPTKE